MEEPLHLLVVDDEKALGRSVRRALERQGHRVVLCETAEAARRAAGYFDAAVFDIELAGETGVDLARQLLDDGRVGVAVFFSGTADVNVRQRAEQVGRFVEKRHGIDALLETLLDACSQPGDLPLAACAGGESRPSPTTPPPTHKRPRSS